MSTIRLTRPLERALRAGHPWVYRDALDPQDTPPGTWVSLLDRRGRPLGAGLTDAGPIGLRLWTLRRESFPELLSERTEAAFALRDGLPFGETTAYRMLHGEGDRTPGVVMDRYGATAVLRLDGEGIRTRLEAITRALELPLRRRGITTLLVRRPRGQAGVKVDVAFGAAPADLLPVREHGMTLLVDLLHGQKTGLFLDHRESRLRVRALSTRKRVLNLYAYTGGFSVAAGLGGASDVTTVDIAPGAVELAGASWEANDTRGRHNAICADVPEFLAQERGRYDLIVADPPSFAPKRKAVEAATEAYAKLHHACLGRLSSDGLYLAASCSSHVDADRFADTLREGARRARRIVQVLDRWSAPADHPRLLAFPEGDYLSVLLCRASE